MVIDVIKSVIRATKEMGLTSIYAWATSSGDYKRSGYSINTLSKSQNLGGEPS